jgi:hypothetical protein
MHRSFRSLLFSRGYGQPLAHEMILQDDGPDPAAVPEDFEGGLTVKYIESEHRRSHMEN